MYYLKLLAYSYIEHKNFKSSRTLNAHCNYIEKNLRNEGISRFIYKIYLVDLLQDLNIVRFHLFLRLPFFTIYFTVSLNLSCARVRNTESSLVNVNKFHWITQSYVLTGMLEQSQCRFFFYNSFEQN